MQLTLIEQLRHMGRVRPEVDQFTLESGDRRIAVSYSGGSTESLVLSMPYPVAWPGSPAPHHAVSAPRPLGITLSFEGTFHVAAKELGVNREAQVGDPEFDRLIYIDSRTPDAIVNQVLAAPEARRAVVELCRLGADVVLDDGDGDITARIVSLPERDPNQERGIRICDALDRLTRSVPPVQATLVRAPRDWIPTAIGVTGVCSLLFLVVPIVLSIFLAEPHCDGIGSCFEHPDCCAPLGAGTGASVLFTLPLGAFYFFTLRGRSSSCSTILAAVAVTFFFLALVFISIARLVL
jgi:hypothetical protein